MTELALALAMLAATGFAPEPYRWLGTVAMRSGVVAGVVVGASMRKQVVSSPQHVPESSPEVAPRAPKK